MFRAISIIGLSVCIFGTQVAEAWQPIRAAKNVIQRMNTNRAVSRQVKALRAADASYKTTYRDTLRSSFTPRDEAFPAVLAAVAALFAKAAQGVDLMPRKVAIGIAAGVTALTSASIVVADYKSARRDARMATIAKAVTDSKSNSQVAALLKNSPEMMRDFEQQASANKAAHEKTYQRQEGAMSQEKQERDHWDGLLQQAQRVQNN